MAMNTRRRRAAWMGMLVLSILLTACTGTARLREASTLPSVARERMLGNWHIIANVPYFAERDKVATLSNVSAEERQVRLELDMSDNLRSLTLEGLDLAIRFGDGHWHGEPLTLQQRLGGHEAEVRPLPRRRGRGRP